MLQARYLLRLVQLSPAGAEDFSLGREHRVVRRKTSESPRDDATTPAPNIEFEDNRTCRKYVALHMSPNLTCRIPRHILPPRLFSTRRVHFIKDGGGKCSRKVYSRCSDWLWRWLSQPLKRRTPAWPSA